MDKKVKMKMSLLIIFLLFFNGCSHGKQMLTVAYQFGTAYAPLELMRISSELSDAAGVPIKWLQLQNSTTIRESMLSGETDIGFMAIPPFLIGYDGGTEWRIITGLSSMQMGLVTREAVSDISQIAENARIAVPQPGSVQHILLAMAAERELDDSSRFDNRLVTVSHPDGMSLLLSGGDVNYHFTTAPYLQNELDAGMKLLLDGEQAFGGKFTGIVGVAQNSFLKEHSDICAAFLTDLEAAIMQINQEPLSAAKLLAPVYGMDEARLLDELTSEGASYNMDIDGVPEFAEFMFRTQYIKKLPQDGGLIFETKKQ